MATPLMRSGFSITRRRRWRICAAWCAMAALVWNAATPLPWLLRDIASEHEVSSAASEGHAHGAHQSDGADIPGSPTHPEDHDCAQCEVLKHLARCVMPDPAVPGVAVLEAASVKPPAFAESRYAFRFVTRPRIRGPPIDNA
jgi:hypothetical protein